MKYSLTILLILSALVFLSLLTGSSATLAYSNLDWGTLMGFDIRHFAFQSPQDMVVNAEADAQVLAATPDINFGTTGSLNVDSPGEESYIRFTVSGVNGVQYHNVWFFGLDRDVERVTDSNAFV